MNYIEEKALVSDVDGEFIFLIRETNSSCNKCSSGKGCGNLDYTDVCSFDIFIALAFFACIIFIY